DDAVVNVVTAPANSADENGELALLTVCRNGYGKRTALSEYRSQGRGGKGVIDIKADDRNGPVLGTVRLSDKDELMLITSTGKIIRMAANSISLIGRNTKGVRLVNLDSEEYVAAVARIAESDDENSEILLEEHTVNG